MALVDVYVVAPSGELADLIAAIVAVLVLVFGDGVGVRVFQRLHGSRFIAKCYSAFYVRLNHFKKTLFQMYPFWMFGEVTRNWSRRKTAATISVVMERSIPGNVTAMKFATGAGKTLVVFDPDALYRWHTAPWGSNPGRADLPFKKS